MLSGQMVLLKPGCLYLLGRPRFLCLLSFIYIALASVIMISYLRNSNDVKEPKLERQLQHLGNIAALLNTSDSLPTIINVFQDAYLYKNYCILKNIIENKLQHQQNYLERITMILHCSSDQLDERLLEQVNAWDGPVSVAVVLPELNTANAIDEVVYTLKYFEPFFQGKVSAHLLYRTDKDCSLNDGNSVNAVSKQYTYPANVARNVARMMSSTKFILLADYEYIFSKNFERQMRRLVKRVTEKNPKTALIFRIFEYNDTLDSPPRDKETLYHYYQTGDVVVFHAKYAGKLHYITGLTEWFERNSSKTEATIDRTFLYNRAGWEPQFVSLATIPYHDENFPYPICDNTVLRWEMCRMNYTWILVNDHFMVHRGIKTSSKTVAKLRKIVRPRYVEAVRRFRERMDHDYPETKSMCPDPSS